MNIRGPVIYDGEVSGPVYIQVPTFECLEEARNTHVSPVSLLLECSREKGGRVSAVPAGEQLLQDATEFPPSSPGAQAAPG